MPDHVTILRHHAGTLFGDPKPTDGESLYDHIYRLQKTPDDVSLPENITALENNLRQFLLSAFALDQKNLDRQCLYAFSELGAALSMLAYRCETLSGSKEWLRLKFVLDVSFDAIIAGDMQPYAEMVGNHLNALGVHFSFSDNLYLPASTT